MFPSALNIESSIVRLQSRRAITTNGIKLDFCEPHGQQKRSSFLPDTWNRDFTESNVNISKKSCSVFFTPRDLCGERIIKDFCTGSKYTGQHNKLGMAGRGIYRFPHGVIYDGSFNKKGDFHGPGTLVYPGGQKVEGIWKNGKLLKGASCVTIDEVPLSSYYCRMPDRRFQIEVVNELAPAGQEYLTNQPNPPIEIPKGCYDCGEGFYDPHKNIIMNYKDPKLIKYLSEFADVCNEEEEYNLVPSCTENREHLIKLLHQKNITRKCPVVSIPIERKKKWILENCRREWTEPTKFRPEFYEIWTSGKGLSECSLIDYEAITEEDKKIEEMAKIGCTLVASHRSTLIGFIMIPDEPKIESPESILALAGMLIRSNQNPQLKEQMNKIIKFHYTKNKYRKVKKNAKKRIF